VALDGRHLHAVMGIAAMQVALLEVGHELAKRKAVPPRQRPLHDLADRFIVIAVAIGVDVGADRPVQRIADDLHDVERAAGEPLQAAEITVGLLVLPQPVFVDPAVVSHRFRQQPVLLENPFDNCRAGRLVRPHHRQVCRFNERYMRAPQLPIGWRKKMP
jgi:hypothetical protein